MVKSSFLKTRSFDLKGQAFKNTIVSTWESGKLYVSNLDPLPASNIAELLWEKKAKRSSICRMKEKTLI